MCLRLKHTVRRVVTIPIAVKQPPLGFHLPKKRRAGVRCHDVEGGALEFRLFYPGHGPLEDVRTVMIETEHETSR